MPIEPVVKTTIHKGVFSSLFFKLAATIFVAVGISGVVLVTLSLRGSNAVVDQLTAVKDQEITVLLSDAMVGSFQMMNANGVRRRLEPLVDATDPNSPTVIALGQNGHDLARMGPQIADMDDLDRLAKAALETGEEQSARGGFYFAKPVRARGQERVLGALAFARNGNEAHNLVWKDQKRSLILSSAIFVVALLGIMFGLRQLVMRPLNDIGAAVRQMAQKDYGVSIPVAKRQDALGKLARSLIRFAGELEKAAQAEQENQFRGTAFEGASTCLMMMDDTLRINALNPAMRRLLTDKSDVFEKALPNYSVTHIEETSFELFLGMSASPGAIDLIIAAENLPCAVTLVAGDSRFQVEVNDVRDSDGAVIGYVAEWKDVSDSFVNQALLNALDENQIKVDLSMTGHLMSCSPHFSALQGRPTEELEGEDFSMLYAGQEKEGGTFEDILAQLSQGGSLYGHFLLKGQNGKTAVVDGGFVPVKDLDGTVLRIVLIATDVTEARFEIEAAEGRRAEMEAAQAHVVDALRDGLSRLSDGDLTAALETPFSENYEQLRHDFNRAVDNLLSAMRGVVDNADLIQGEASEISNAADDLSQRTEKQAATLEETAAALDELTSSVRSAADGASHASDVVETARKNAEASGEVVREAVDAMGEIESSSLQISKITGVIDDIAFQTNLLALNAGVEAARAGEAGRGFAVVASEVRALAQRSSDAAREINELISASGTQVKRGVQLVDQAGEALAGIVESVSEISNNVGEIAVSSREQSAGLAEINAAVNQLDQVTQQNAAMFEETTAASHALTREANSLTQTMGRFNTGQMERSEAEVITPDVFNPAEKVASAEDFVVRSAPTVPQPIMPSIPSQSAQAVQSEPEDNCDDWDDF